MKLESLHDGLARQIHERLRFEDDVATAGICPFASQAGEGLTAHGAVPEVSQAVQKKETRIMAGPLILGAGIAQPRYDECTHG